MRIPTIETEHLLIRDFTLEDAAIRQQVMEEGFGEPVSAEDNALWMQWTMLGYGEFAKIYQPPYGERALCLKTTGEVIGAVGFVPAGVPWAVLAEFRQPNE